MPEFYQNFKDELIPIYLILFQEMELEGTLSNSFYETSITLILRPKKDATKKRITDQYMNIDAKTLSKILAEFNVYQNGHTQFSSQFHFRDARMVQHT
jgi:hypothetical protein